MVAKTEDAGTIEYTDTTEYIGEMQVLTTISLNNFNIFIKVP